MSAARENQTRTMRGCPEPVSPGGRATPPETGTPRAVYEDALGLLPRHLRAAVYERLGERGRMVPDCTSWGTLGFELVCDSLRVSRHKAQPLRRLWNLLYAYSILLDDVIDDVGSHPAYEIMACEVLLDALHVEIGSLADPEGVIAASFRKHRLQSIESMSAELQAPSVIFSLSERSMDILLGRKSAMLKFYADVVSYYHAGRVCTRSEAEGFDYLCAGIQILDDLTDLDDDVASARVNALSVFIRNTFPGVAALPVERRGDGARAALVACGRYEAMLHRAEEHLQLFFSTCQGREGGTGRVLTSTLAESRETRYRIALHRHRHSKECSLVRKALGNASSASPAHDAEVMGAILGLSKMVRNGVRAAN